MQIENIDPSNKSLEYIANRIESPKYRGDHRSQHNRYDFDRAFKILECLNKYALY